MFVSATPGDFELEKSQNVTEQVIRPTGLLDPEIFVRPTKGQIDDLIGEITERTKIGERVLITTLTKKMAEDLTTYLKLEYSLGGDYKSEKNATVIFTKDNKEKAIEELKEIRNHELFRK